MPLSPGTRLGPYEIVAPIGAGGMGEVYKATDTRLDRTVAVKVLPEQLASSPERRERLNREAKAISQLNHPNICTLHDVGEQDGTDYLVMEYIEGETLAETLNSRALKVDEALEYGAQIAEGLAQAHRAGIVHRDLKPANIMLTRSGVKILDFGLARERQDVPAGGSEAATARKPLTSDGVAVGTPSYMAPEQILGDPVDARIDHFALGAVLYEMLSGRRAFEGTTTSEITAAILKDEPPPLQRVADECPARIAHLVEACLVKTRDDRWQSASDLARELRWRDSAASGPVGDKGRMARWGVGAIVLFTSLILGTLYVKLSAPELAVRALSVGPPSGNYLDGFSPAVSPDGTLLAFTAQDVAGRRRLWLQGLVDGTSRPIAESQSTSFPFFSFNGSEVYFDAADGLRAVTLASGAERLVNAPSFRGASINEDGTILHSPNGRSGLFAKAPGEDAVPVTELDTEAGEVAHRHPNFLPDGKHFVFLNTHASPEATTVDLGSLAQGKLQTLVHSIAAGRYANEQLFFVRDGVLFAQRFDIHKLELDGEPVSLVTGVGGRFGHTPNVAVSESGTLAYGPDFLAWSYERHIAWYTRKGERIARLGEPARYNSVSLSPDEARVAVTIDIPVGGTSDVWVLDETGLASRITSNPMNDGSPVWSPAGDKLLFFSDRDSGNRDLFVRDLTRPDDDPLKIIEHAQALFASDWDDAGRIWFWSGIAGQNEDIWLWENGAAVPIIESPQHESMPRLSPDGRWLALVSNESGSNEVYVEPFGRAGERTRVSHAGGLHPQWRGDSKELFYVEPSGYLVAAIVGVAGATPARLFSGIFSGSSEAPSFAASSDGHRFLIIEDPDQPPSSHYTILADWRALLDEK